MFGIGGWELAWLVVLAVLLTPPDKIPELSRKAARVVWFIRNIANNATTQLRNELGPEYADLTVQDLNPKVFVKKHLVGQLEKDIEDIRTDLQDVRSELDGGIGEAAGLFKDANETVGSTLSGTGESAPVSVSPFDDEAT